LSGSLSCRPSEFSWIFLLFCLGVACAWADCKAGTVTANSSTLSTKNYWVWTRGGK
jgi:hypothetical protein